MEQIKYRYYAFRLFQLSFPLFFLLLVYRAIPLLFISETTKGTVVDIASTKYSYSGRYGSKGRLNIRTPIINYVVNGKKYRTLGGYDAQLLVGEEVKVWYLPYAPEYALEKSFNGIVNFHFISKYLLWYLLISAILFAYSNYEIFKFRLPVINTKRFFALMGLAFAIPLLWWMPLFLHGNIIHGRVTSDLTMQKLHYYRTIVGSSNQQQITALTALEESYYKDDESTSIIFNTQKPTEAYEFSFYTFYSNATLVSLLIFFVVLSAMRYISGFDQE